MGAPRDPGPEEPPTTMIGLKCNGIIFGCLCSAVVVFIGIRILRRHCTGAKKNIILLHTLFMDYEAAVLDYFIDCIIYLT